MLQNINSFHITLRLMVVIIVLVKFSGHIIAQDQVLQIASKKQLFIDDQLVAHAINVKWRVNPPRKAGPVITPIPDVEGPYIATNTILPVGNEYWIYYSFYALKNGWKGIGKVKCLVR